MGRSATEIQSDLERQRHAVEARVSRFNRRVREGAARAGDELLGDVERVMGSDSAAAEHPKSLIAGAAGAGLALGIISESVGLARPHLPSRNGHKSSADGSARDAKKKGLLAVATGAAAGAFQGQLNELLTDAWNGFRSGFNNTDERDADRAGAIAVAPDHNMTREEIEPMSNDTTPIDKETDAERHRKDEEEARKILHDAKVEDLNPRADNALVHGVLGGGAIVAPAPDRDGPLDERRSGT